MRELYHYKRVPSCPYGCCGPLRPKTKARSVLLSHRGAIARSKVTRIEHRLVRRLRKREIQTELDEMV